MTICGGGNAAHVLAPLAAQAGWEVDIFAPFADEAQRLRAGMQAQDGLQARFADGAVLRGEARCISGDAADVIPDATLVLLALPAYAHGATLLAIAPYLRDGATIVALPARSGFAMQARRALGVDGKAATIAGLQTLPWACRTVRYGGEVSVLGSKSEVDIAVYPAARTAETAALLEDLLRVPLRAIGSFLALTLANTGQLIHPGIMYGLCQGREGEIYQEAEIPMFYQGVDHGTAALLQALSDEVQCIARALCEQLADFNAEEVSSLYDWLLRAYPDDIADKRDLQHAFNSNRAYKGLRLPVRAAENGRYRVDFAARYLSEDVPCGLVVVRGIAELAGLATPAIDAVIRWAQERLGKRYLDNGALGGPDVHSSRAPQAYGVTRLSELQGGIV